MPARSVTHRQVLAFVWRYAREHLPMLLLMFLLLILRTGLELVQPFFYKEAVDTVATHGAGDAAALRFASIMVLLGVGVALLGNTLYQLSNHFLAWVETRVIKRAHADVFAHVQRLPMHFHVNAFAGATARKIGRGTDAVESILDHFWFNFLPLGFTALGFTVVLSLYAPLIGVAIIAGMAVYIPFSIGINLWHMRYYSWADRQDTRVTGSLVDAITGNATVKSFGAEDREKERHEEVLTEWQRRLWKTWGIGQVIGWLHNALLIAIECVLLLLALWLWYRGEFTAGGFIVVVFYIGRLWGYVRDIGREVRNYLKSVAHVQEMVSLYETPLDIADAEGAAPLTVTQGEIRFENVRFSYEQAVNPVFSDFTLTIAPGEKIALVGHSGGGKSTFVKLLLRLYDLDAGHILIDGQDIAHVTQESLRRSIALVPQDPILFHRSIAENIAYAKPGASPADIERVAKLAHAHEFIERLPKKYDTLVGERGVKLSGGERQRVAIARAMLADTPILILDEATSSLDSLSEKYIQEALASLMRGRTSIVIAHRLSTIKRVDRILVVAGGRIVEEGPHAALLKKKDGLYKHFYELQAGGFLGE